MARSAVGRQRTISRVDSDLGTRNTTMARIYGFLGGVVVGLSTVYGAALLMRTNTAAISRELHLADDIARRRPRVVRPYTDPIDLKTRSLRDTIADTWNAELIRALNYFYSRAEDKK